MDVGERGIVVPVDITDLNWSSLTSSLTNHHHHHRRFQFLRDGQNIDEICCKSVRRCQCEARPVLARIRYDFAPVHRLAVLASDVAFEDNLQVQWGSQDHYEIVRKVGRGKYSEVSASLNDPSTLETSIDTNNSG